MRNDLTKSKRLSRELKTVEMMIDLYCKDHHEPKYGWCESCEDLITYAEHRLGLCPYGEKKPTCAKCPIHCYKAGPKEQIKNVMRYSGPRMLTRHPLLTLRHMMDGLKKVPPKSEKNR